MCGAGDRSRTYDLRITNALLYQLSYTGKTCRTESKNPRTSRRRILRIAIILRNRPPHLEQPYNDQVIPRQHLGHATLPPPSSFGK